MAEAAKVLDDSGETEAPKPSRELNKLNSARELVFGIVGHAGSGTSTVAECLHAILQRQSVDGSQQQVVILKAKNVIKTGLRSILKTCQRKILRGWMP